MAGRGEARQVSRYVVHTRISGIPKARPGSARRGKARLGKARRGKDSPGEGVKPFIRHYPARGSNAKRTQQNGVKLWQSTLNNSK
jgi:hypothetical protein